MRTTRAALDELRLVRIAHRLRMHAWQGIFNGRENMAYIARCKWDDELTRTRVIFTRDAGHHSSGWMRNPDFERCWHLSLSPAPALIYAPGSIDLDPKAKAAWLRAFFGDDARYTWEESAKTPQGKERGVIHYRLFCDAAWQPILPRGEVYSSELTELGWRSASQVLEEDGVLIQSVLDPT